MVRNARSDSKLVHFEDEPVVRRERVDAVWDTLQMHGTGVGTHSGQHIGEETHSPHLPVTSYSPAVPLHERQIEKGGKERTQQSAAHAENAHITSTAKADGTADEYLVQVAPMSASHELLTNQHKLIKGGTPACD
ncbi:MAG: hypothetical protein ABJB22_04565 [Verrucomicrobiota bacterium]